ncbi:MAG: Hsp20/alpha crystallin family protein [Candidatus Lokiarchaeota archaeon]|nr:Hsp20/alpha crystallin family protein [Candidatus Lokiarchaeota archaeon]
MTEEHKEKKRTHKHKRQVWVNANSPNDCGCQDPDDELMILNYEIPGANKEKIHLHVVENGLRLVAPRSDEDYDYVSTYSFTCPADPKNVKAKYNDGILEVHIPYNCPNPYKDIPPVTIE